MKIKKANNFIFFILRVLFTPFLFIKYGFKFVHKTSKNIKRPCLIISNHISFIDQFIIGCGFKFGVNFVGSDSLFREGLKSRIMQKLANPIPIKKGTADIDAIKNIMKVVKSGGSVCLFPEGNRCFYGDTGTVKATIGRLAKKLGVPLVIVRIEGGYNTIPRWKKKTNKGKMRAYVKMVLEPEKLAELSDDEVNKIILEGLNFNEYEFNRVQKIKFKGRRKAEYLETALFACPECHSLDGLKSFKNEFFCEHCGMKVKINDTGFFEKIANADEIPDNILDFSKIQLDIVKAIDFSLFTDKPLVTDKNVTLYKCERAKRNEPILSGDISLFSDRITIGGKTFKIDDIDDMAVQGVYKFQIYAKNGEMYMVKASNLRQNLMKYMVLSYQLKYNLSGSDGDYYGY